MTVRAMLGKVNGGRDGQYFEGRFVRKFIGPIIFA